MRHPARKPATAPLALLPAPLGPRLALELANAINGELDRRGKCPGVRVASDLVGGSVPGVGSLEILASTQRGLVDIKLLGVTPALAELVARLVAREGGP